MSVWIPFAALALLIVGALVGPYIGGALGRRYR